MFLRIIWNRKTRFLILFLLKFFPINRNRVIALCWGGKNYNCNPRAITDELIRRQSCFKQNDKLVIFYAFEDVDEYKSILPVEIVPVQIGSLYYFYLLATSHFIISNTRIGGGVLWPFPKKKKQYYIQTMHGGHGMKRQELEVKDSLSEEYIKVLFDDAKRTDLMISDSTFWTKLARTVFAYPKGEILECGLPRNDLFFISEKEKQELKKEYLCKLEIGYELNVPINTLVYCPTFRNNGRRDVYGFDTDKIIFELENRFGGIWYILVSSHPNMRDYYHEIYDFSHPRMVDIGTFPDLQPFLIFSDAAITDYSSAGFEFTLTGKPLFLHVKDLQDYDRGVYFDMHKLPFPFSDNDGQLCMNIRTFDKKEYHYQLESFNREIIGLKERGESSRKVVDWILDKQTKN